VSAASNIKTILGINKEQKKQEINRCGICSKKLKNFKRRISENPLSCWQ
jgi:hypothetical protein